MGCLLQGLFLTQASNPCLLHLLKWQANSLPLCHPGSSAESSIKEVISEGKNPAFLSCHVQCCLQNNSWNYEGNTKPRWFVRLLRFGICCKLTLITMLHSMCALDFVLLIWPGSCIPVPTQSCDVELGDLPQHVHFPIFCRYFQTQIKYYLPIDSFSLIFNKMNSHTPLNFCNFSVTEN